MVSGRYVGRVGGLAVALGVGAVVLVGAPAAWAQDESAGRSSESTSAEKSRDERPKRTPSEARPAKNRETSRADNDRSESKDDEPKETVTVARSPRLLGTDSGGGEASPASWVLTAAARREIGDTSTTDAAEQETALHATASDATTTSLPLNDDGTRFLLETTEGDWEVGFTTREEVVDGTGATIGEPFTLDGFSTGTQVSADGSRLLITAVDFDSDSRATSSLTVVDVTTGLRVGTTFAFDGDDSSRQWLTPDGTLVLVTADVYDSRTSTFTTEATVFDVAAGAPIGQPLRVAGRVESLPLVTSDGTRAVLTTFVDEPGTSTTSTRVAVLDTTTGEQTGTTVTINGHPSRAELTGDTARITTDLGLQATVDTNTGRSVTFPVEPPWGFDVNQFSYTPLGQAVAGIVLVTSVVLTFYVIVPAIAVYDTIASALGLPTFSEWQLSQLDSRSA